MSWIYDAHIHLSDPEYKSDIDMILNYMDLLKIKACCVSMDLETSNETMNLYEKSKKKLGGAKHNIINILQQTTNWQKNIFIKYPN